MTSLLSQIDARSRLAGTNKLEILMFSLGLDQATGRRETFGINVFKVREVMRTPAITAAPEMPETVTGMVSLRGALVPVVDLAKFARIDHSSQRDIMIVTEYNDHVQGFLVEAVDTILRLDWSMMRLPPEMVVARMGGLVTAVTQLADGRLVMMLDVEKVLDDTTGGNDNRDYLAIPPMTNVPQASIYFCDDSQIARSQIRRTLDALGLSYVETCNGRQAWESIDRAAQRAREGGRGAAADIAAIITDVEMPEMDGYMLTRQIKSDPRLAGIPVIMHSSLSAEQNQGLGYAVGVDEYVSKFEPQRLAQVLQRHIEVTA